MIVEKTINKKKYIFKFTSLTLRKICEIKGIEFHEYDNYVMNDYTNWINTLLRASIDVGSQGEVKVSEYEADDLIEVMAQAELQEVINGYFQSLKTLAEKYGIEVAEDEKKN